MSACTVWAFRFVETVLAVMTSLAAIGTSFPFFAGVLAMSIFLTVETTRRVWNVNSDRNPDVTDIDMFRNGR